MIDLDRCLFVIRHYAGVLVALNWTAEQGAMIARHGERGYPNEICGFLLGTRTDGTATVREVVPVENHWEALDERRRRFMIAPEDFLREERRAREAGWEILGFYHSHPDHPARPSETDREAAWPGYSYVIQSVRDSSAAEVTSWLLKDDRSGYDQEDIVDCGMRSADSASPNAAVAGQGSASTSANPQYKGEEHG
ncbi:MAG TPA: M67 family metallopeptidase [Thermomicrobiales bacterium]|nr:M67 family metallopeptidase [Thermomicrobiales bacterium]